MKLLVVSHSFSTPLNQSFYADVEQVTGWSISLIVPARWKTEYSVRSAERWPALRGTIHPIPVFQSGNIPLHLYRSSFVALLRSLRPDAIYVQHEPYGAATAQVYLANRICDRVLIGFYAAQNILKNYPPPFRWTESFVLKESSFCFPVTDDALGILRTKGYRGDAEVLPLAIDTDLYRPMPEAAAALREKLGISPSEPIIGYLGRLVPEKGLVTLVKALDRIRGLPWSCVLVGNGPMEAELRQVITAAHLESRFRFVGYVPHTEAPQWLSLFDILALPSESQPNWKEQFGRVIVEANACGTPVVGTLCGEIPHVLERTGGGLVVSEGSPEELATAFRRLIESPALRYELAVQGQSSSHREYSQVRLARRFSDTILRNFPRVV